MDATFPHVGADREIPSSSQLWTPGWLFFPSARIQRHRTRQRKRLAEPYLRIPNASLGRHGFCLGHFIIAYVFGLEGKKEMIWGRGRCGLRQWLYRRFCYYILSACGLETMGLVAGGSTYVTDSLDYVYFTPLHVGFSKQAWKHTVE
ncbi:unnamed protein product [Periconia digitata]|uniref:Uncharacterized protein n=1 Tax=Periconia digitata TaxID=1303443 RepID=A0A9W4XXU8_9PLEO|nr:unnamed protein product [Periconia digitata]